MSYSICKSCLAALAFLASSNVGRVAIYTDCATFDLAVSTAGLTAVNDDIDGLVAVTVIAAGSPPEGITYKFAGDAFDFFFNAAFDTTSGGHSLGVNAFVDAEDNYFIDGEAWSMRFAPTRAVRLYVI